MAARAYIPKRGDIVWIDLDPTRGHEQAGHRPVVVLTGSEFNKRTGLAFIVPVTAKRKGYAIEVPVVAEQIDGVALTSNVRAIDWRERRVRYAAPCPDAALRTIQGMLVTFIIDGER